MITNIDDRFFKSDADKLREAEELLALLKDSPELEQRRRQHDEARVVKIQRLLDELAKLKADHAREFPKVQAAADEALRAEKLAQQALEAAAQDRVKAEHERLCASLTFSSARDRLEREIQQSAPAEIDAFIAELAKLENGKIDLEVRYDAPHRLTGKISGKTIRSNIGAITERRQFIQAARAEAEAMKSQALPIEQIKVRLAELKAKVPEFDRLTEKQVELPDVRELMRPE